MLHRKRFSALLIILLGFGVSALSALPPELGHVQVFNPTDSGLMVLYNQQHQAINCHLVGYDPERKLVRIRMKDQNQSMWFSPDLLDGASRSMVDRWVDLWLLHDGVQITVKRVSENEEGAKFYTLDVRNFTGTTLSGLKIECAVFVQSRAYNSDPNNSMLGVHQNSGLHVSHRTLSLKKLEPDESITLQTQPIQLASESRKGKTHSMQQYSVDGRTHTNVTSKSHRSSYSEELKGAAFYLVKDFMILRTAYSDRRVKELAENE